MNKTKVIATVGPVSSNKDVIKKSILQVINESEIKELVIRELKEEMVNSPYGVILSELNL